MDVPKNSLESLKVESEDFLTSEVLFEDEALMAVIKIPQPYWRLEQGE